MLFVINWKIPLETRTSTYTKFASMSDEDELDNKGRCVGLTRLHNLGTMTGTEIFECPSAADAFEYLWKWTEDLVEDVKIKVLLNDNEARELILKGQKPAFTTKYDKISMEPPEGSSLYVVHWKFTSFENKTKAFEYFGSMTEEQDKADVPDDITVLCRFHDVSNGEGFAVGCVSDDENANMLLHKWTYNWAGLVDLWWEPVLTDTQVKKLVKSKPGYEKKLEAVKAETEKK